MTLSLYLFAAFIYARASLCVELVGKVLVGVDYRGDFCEKKQDQCQPGFEEYSP